MFWGLNLNQNEDYLQLDDFDLLCGNEPDRFERLLMSLLELLLQIFTRVPLKNDCLRGETERLLSSLTSVRQRVFGFNDSSLEVL